MYSMLISISPFVTQQGAAADRQPAVAVRRRL